MEIKEIPSDVELYDVMGGCSRWDIRVHEHGLISLVDVMPRMAPVGQTADYAVVQAARVSYGHGTKRMLEDEGLARYLLRHLHTTPYEMVEFKFHCRVPMFVARQWLRHRTANVNEYSARYSMMPDMFYVPSTDDVRRQSTHNRQGGDDSMDEMTTGEFLTYLDEMHVATYGMYQEFLEKGVTREQARIALPVSVYTEFYWKCDLHNILHFLKLRMDSHAQKEIRDYANAMFELVKAACPVAAQAFVDYIQETVTLTRLEVEAIRTGSATIGTTNTRERKEWEEKRTLMGLEMYTYGRNDNIDEADSGASDAC